MQNNPFVLPGFGQSGPAGQNPILASMEMMRQAWEGLASTGGLDAATMGRIMSVEEMDKRIADLRAVENWLRMNLSMLTSTIQGLEVQRATVATLKSFVDTSAAPVAGGSDAARGASPLDEVLKSWSSKNGDEPKAARAEPAPAAQPEAPVAPSQPSQATQPQQATDTASAAAPEGAADQNDIMAAAASAAQGWWGLLQQQFQTLAAATAASAEGAMADLAEAGKAVSEATAASAKPKPASKAPVKTAARSAAAKKTAPAKPVAKKAARKTAAKTAAKTAVKKTAKTTAKKAPAARKTAG